jgi:hypothetical protein
MTTCFRIIYADCDIKNVDECQLNSNCQIMAIKTLKTLTSELFRIGTIDIEYTIKILERLIPKVKDAAINSHVALQSEIITLWSVIICQMDMHIEQHLSSFHGKLDWKMLTILFSPYEIYRISRNPS